MDCVTKIGEIASDARYLVDRSPPCSLSARSYLRFEILLELHCAQMAELVDAPSSGGGARKGVEVRVLFWAPFHCFTTSHVVPHPGKIIYF